MWSWAADAARHSTYWRPAESVPVRTGSTVGGGLRLGASARAACAMVVYGERMVE